MPGAIKTKDPYLREVVEQVRSKPGVREKLMASSPRDRLMTLRMLVSEHMLRKLMTVTFKEEDLIDALADIAEPL